MTIKLPEDFDLTLIHESGQCFRWRTLPEHTPERPAYLIPASGRVLRIRLVSGDTYDVDCDKKEWDTFWHHYFDLETDYAAIRTLVKKKNDPYLHAACAFGKGIRILNQDPFETLITFIISQRKNIPAIRKAVEAICAAAEIPTQGCPDVFAFPEPDALFALDTDTLSSCSLGYRTPYIRGTVEAVMSGGIDLNAVSALDDEALLNALMALHGVGIKVASCVALFAYHRLDLFPRDVWILRVLENEYRDGFPFDDYAPFNGVMQQYLFHYSRSVS